MINLLSTSPVGLFLVRRATGDWGFSIARQIYQMQTAFCNPSV